MKMKIERKGGRPKGTWVVYSPQRRKKLLELMMKYIEETDYPQIAEFSYKNSVERTQLYEWDEFVHPLKKLRAKQQASLVSNTLHGKFNPAMAIFCLKNNHGWKDVQVQEHQGNINLVIRPASEDKRDGNEIPGGNGKLLPEGRKSK